MLLKYHLSLYLCKHTVVQNKYYIFIVVITTGFVCFDHYCFILAECSAKPLWKIKTSALNRAWRPEEGALTLWNSSRAQQEGKKKKRSFFFVRGFQTMRSHGLFVYNSPPNFCFPSIKELSFPWYTGTCRWLSKILDLKMQFSAVIK